MTIILVPGVTIILGQTGGLIKVIASILSSYRILNRVGEDR